MISITKSEETRLAGGKQSTVQSMLRSMAIGFTHLFTQEARRVSEEKWLWGQTYSGTRIHSSMSFTNTEFDS